MNETKSKIGKDELKKLVKFGASLKINTRYRTLEEIIEIAEALDPASTLIVVAEKSKDIKSEMFQKLAEIKGKNIIFDFSEIDL